MADASADAPIEAEDLDRLFFPLLASCADERLALAVSGGSDSTALMVLLAEWLRRNGRSPPAFTVLTVDHRLRPESTAEAEAVVRQAAVLGFGHAILVWEGEKPKAGLQAAARAVRYRLMAAYARVHGIGAILTAHTADDQAETLLMRLARGSGLDGLSAMAPSAFVQDDEAPIDAPRLRLLRPLLEVPKTRLQASLRRRGIGWLEDPSNASPAFERVRLRAAGAEFDSLGLTGPTLALSARRLQQARAALERWVADILAPAGGVVTVHPCGFIRVDLFRLRALPQEIVCRVLARAVAAVGGSREPIPLAGLEAIVEAILPEHAAGAWTLARTKLSVAGADILLTREPGREPLAQLQLVRGQTVLWDGRFRVSAGRETGSPVDVVCLGLEGLKEARKLLDLSGVPADALRALPAFRRRDTLLAIPALDFWSDEDSRRTLAATFLGLDNR